MCSQLLELALTIMRLENLVVSCLTNWLHGAPSFTRQFGVESSIQHIPSQFKVVEVATNV